VQADARERVQPVVASGATGALMPRFNDSYYCRTVEEWENEIVPRA
jgi:hypothetical protein